MCVCVCVFVCVRVRACVRVREYVPVSWKVYTCMAHTYTHARTRTYAHARMRALAHTHTRTRTHTKTHIDLSVRLTRLNDSTGWLRLEFRYGVATVRRIDKIIGLFCKRDIKKNDAIG